MDGSAERLQPDADAPSGRWCRQGGGREPWPERIARLVSLIGLIEIELSRGQLDRSPPDRLVKIVRQHRLALAALEAAKRASITEPPTIDPPTGKRRPGATKILRGRGA